MKSESPFDLSGRVALVTGSSKGLGKAMAVALGRCGASVALNYANGVEAAERTMAEMRGEGLKCGLFPGDVTDEAACGRVVAAIADSMGSVDVLVVNATCDQPQAPIEGYQWAVYQRMIDFFIKSPFLLTKAVLPQMKSRRWGRIINMGSEALQLGAPNFSAYVAAKGGQSGWTRSMANELAPWSITVNMISPGWIPVERHAADSPAIKDAYLATIPIKRWGVPEDLSGAVSLLASNAGSFITGQNIVINGGR